MPGMARKWGRGETSSLARRQASANPCMKKGAAAPPELQAADSAARIQNPAPRGMAPRLLGEQSAGMGLAAGISSLAGRLATGFTDSTLARVFVFANRGRFYTFVPHRV